MRLPKHLYVLLLPVLCASCSGPKKTISPKPATVANASQQAQIARKYGMFIHFGMNTFHDEEWTDGTLPPSSYQPASIDAEQWVKTAKDAGMKYVILVTKHHDGFCLWDSKYTAYDVAESPNKTNVIEKLAEACEKNGIRLGLYYSLWDRHQNANTEDSTLDAAYNTFMINQLKELMEITKKHTSIVEFWFDGGWVKPNYRWPVQELYNTIKSREPGCQVGINWSIGLPGNPDYHNVLPADQKAGYPIRYFPSDFRIGDPYLPADPDPKTFTHNGKSYYMPWESTVCMSGKWFYNTKDNAYKSLDQLVTLYKTATAQDNILIINCPPNREGKMRAKDAALLVELKTKLGL